MAHEIGRARHGADRQAPALPQRVAGKYYMVIQDLRSTGPAKEDEANRIVAFCRDNLEPASVNLYEGRLVVWSFKPFDSPTDPNRLSHAALVEELGRRYFKLHSTYRFSQRRDGEVDPLLLPYVGEDQ